jgi:hypothetical protein
MQSLITAKSLAVLATVVEASPALVMTTEINPDSMRC